MEWACHGLKPTRHGGGRGGREMAISKDILILSTEVLLTFVNLVLIFIINKRK